MPITSINRDNYVGGPSIVRITTSDTLSDIQVSNYVASQSVVTTLLNKGVFEWVVGDFVAVAASDGNGIFQFSGDDFSTFIPLEAGGFAPGPLNNLLAYVADGVGDSGIAKSTVVLNNQFNTMSSATSGLYLYNRPGTVVESGGTVTVNSQTGFVETSSLTTAPGGIHILTMNNTAIKGNSCMFFTYTTLGTSSAGGLVNFLYLAPGVGTCNIGITNGNAGALNGTVGFAFAIIS